MPHLQEPPPSFRHSFGQSGSYGNFFKKQDGDYRPMKTSIIVGSDGQDGRIAFELLSARGDRVLGIDLHGVRSSGVSWDRPVDITKKDDVAALLGATKPDEVYYLAAYHHSSEDRVPDDVELFEKSDAINVSGLLFFLEGIRANALRTRLFYAASSLIFGAADSAIQDENTPFAPDTIYGISKLSGLLLCRHYRAQRNVFVATGILYNHESPYRGANFISKKIIKAAVHISQGRADPLVLGDLNAEIDWGYAPDYVEAMTRILEHERADDFIIASGIKHSVRDFVEIAFGYLGLDWKKHVREVPGVVTRTRKVLVGNPGKLMRTTGWQPMVDFRGMIKILLQAEGASV